MTVGFSEKATALAPLSITRVEFGDGQADVVEREDDRAEEPVGGGGAPLVEQVVVVGAQAGVPEVPVRDVQVEAVAGEACVVGEAELSPHAVDVHVGYPGNRVVAAGPDLIEAGRAGGGGNPCTGRPSKRATRAHGYVDQLVLEEPGLAAVPGIDDPGAAVLEAFGHPIHPQMRRLDHVIVGGVQLGGWSEALRKLTVNVCNIKSGHLDVADDAPVVTVRGVHAAEVPSRPRGGRSGRAPGLVRDRPGRLGR